MQRFSRPATWPNHFALILFFLLSACAGPGRTKTDQEPLPGPVDKPIQYSDYEDFDAEPYEEADPLRQAEAVHDVPAQLMENRADQGVAQQVRGFRIQVFSSLDKAEAVVQEEALKNWWTSLSPEEKQGRGLPGELTIYVRFSQPYYRVRFGDFQSRRQAEAVLPVVANRFPGAFIAPDLVTVIR